MAVKQRSGAGALRRAGLSRERVLRTAVVLADEGGAESVTMRKLAKELGVEAMSLYHHIASKDDLIDAMVDVVFSEIEPPAIGGDWKAELRKRAVSTRDALNRHRWANGLMEGRPNPGPASIGLHNAVLGCLREAGFSIEKTMQAYSVQDAYIYGFALQEKALPFENAEESTAEAQRQVQEFQAAFADYPYLAEMVGGHVSEVGYDFNEAFVFGLDLILDGLERLRVEG
jgi:AcrR family transcriptional regulator